MGVRVVPYLAFENTAQAIEFYQRAFGAVEAYRLEENGKIGHAEIRIGEAVIYLSDSYPEIDVLSPKVLGGSPVMIVLEVEDVDRMFEQAVSAGASVARPLEDSFEGTLRTGKLVDPFGHRWMVLSYKPKTVSG